MTRLWASNVRADWTAALESYDNVVRQQGVARRLRRKAGGKTNQPMPPTRRPRPDRHSRTFSAPLPTWARVAGAWIALGGAARAVATQLVQLALLLWRVLVP